MRSIRMAVFTAMFFSFHFLSATIYTVINNGNGGAGSLRQALTDANGNPGKDTIYFNILPAGQYSISSIPELVITEDVVIDATTQPGYSAASPTPMIELKDSPAMAILINSGAAATGSFIKGFVINSFQAPGILISSSGNIIQGCYIGTNFTGLVAAPTAALASPSGIALNGSSNNLIGGNTAAERNIISGNKQHGVSIEGGGSNTISGNYIGVGSDGITSLGNAVHGILIVNTSTFNTIGGVTATRRNIISSNGSIGINIVNNCKGTIIKNNYIGTAADGATLRGNSTHGIQVQNSRETIIGGNHSTEGNIISATTGAHGINMDPGCNKSVIKGNYIGTDVTGMLDLGNNVIGVVLKSDSCTVGGTTNEEGNIISGTKILCGLLLANASANTVTGNLIGTTSDTTALGNKTDGINISVEDNGQEAINNVVMYNVVAYNQENGINVGDALNNNINNIEYNNNLRFNSVFCNTTKGISLNLSSAADHGNNGKTTPLINTLMSTPAMIVGIPNGLLATDLIDIYEMTDCGSCTNPQGKRYIATISPDASGNWTYNNGTSLTGTFVATATDVDGNTSEFSLCYTPCGITAVASVSETVADLNTVHEKTISLTSSSVGNPLSPLPLQHFWSLNSPDTTGVNLLSTDPTTSVLFNLSGSGSAYSPGTYLFFYITKQGTCLDTLSFSVTSFYIPNLVTPNGDNLNDTWEVSDAELFEAKIYNRWGEMIFWKEGYTNDWDVSHTNEGIYFYQLKDLTGEGKTYKGWVQIVR